MYLFLDYLEVLLVALLICIFCDVEQKNRYCLISSVISFLVMEFMQTYDLFGNEMAYAITIINFIIVSVMKKEIKFYNFIPCIFSMDICFYFNYSFIFL